MTPQKARQCACERGASTKTVGGTGMPLPRLMNIPVSSLALPRVACAAQSQDRRTRSSIMKSLTYSAIAAAGLVVASAGAQAQSSNKADAMTMAKQSSAVADTATLAEWEYNSIYNAGGIRAEYMVTEEVFGPEGEEIGNVENVIVNAQGQIAAIIAEVGGFWDIADTHIAVPWDEVTLIP